MTDIEHAKKYAEDNISLAISMYNPKAEMIAEYACLYGLTYKNDEIDKLKKENEQLKIDNYNHNANLQRVSDMLDEANKIIKDLLWSEIHHCTGEEFYNIRSRAEIFINNEGEEC